MGLGKCGQGNSKHNHQITDYQLRYNRHISKRQPVLVYLYRMKIFAERIKFSNLVCNGLVSEF